MAEGVGTGTYEGGYVGTLTATGLNSSPGLPTHGNIGSYNYGGTGADVLLNDDNVTPFDWVGTYFIGGSSPALTQWGWTYHYKSQTWNDYYNISQASSGDIVVP